MNRIKDKKISSSILVMVILGLVLICLFVLFYEIYDYRNVKSEVHDFYYYFSDRIDFQANITLNSKNTIIGLEANNIVLTSSPIYYKNNNEQMILPVNMEIVYPYKNNPMYKVGKFSKIYYKNNYLYMNSETDTGRLYDCFLYDGEDLYVFVEKTMLIVNEKQYELSPMSFVEVTKGYIKIYNKKKNEYIFIDEYSGVVEGYTEEYVINFLEDTFTYGNSYYMLIKNIEGLNFVEL